MNTRVTTQVRDIEHLREILTDSEDFESFYIVLNGGLRSSKEIRLLRGAHDMRCRGGKMDKFQVHNDIDGSMQTLTEKEIADTQSSRTNIGKAIEQGALYHEDWSA